MPPSQEQLVMSWIQSLKTLNGLADGTREWRNCFLAAATHVVFETSVLEPCVLVLRSPQTGHHGIIGVAVGDIASGGGDVWEQAISELKQRPLLDTGNGAKGNSAVERSHRLQMVVHARQQPGDATELERHAMRSVLGALGYLAHQRRASSVSTIQGRINRAHVLDIQEKNRAVRLAKAHKDIALPVRTIPVGQICFVSYGDASGGSTRAEEVQAVYVVLMAEQASLSHKPGFLEISPYQACCSQCLCSPKRLLKATGCVHYGVKWY